MEKDLFLNRSLSQLNNTEDKQVSFPYETKSEEEEHLDTSTRIFNTSTPSIYPIYNSIHGINEPVVCVDGMNTSSSISTWLVPTPFDNTPWLLSKDVYDSTMLHVNPLHTTIFSSNNCNSNDISSQTFLYKNEFQNTLNNDSSDNRSSCNSNNNYSINDGCYTSTLTTSLYSTMSIYNNESINTNLNNSIQGQENEQNEQNNTKEKIYNSIVVDPKKSLKYIDSSSGLYNTTTTGAIGATDATGTTDTTAGITTNNNNNISANSNSFLELSISYQRNTRTLLSDYTALISNDVHQINNNNYELEHDKKEEKEQKIQEQENEEHKQEKEQKSYITDTNNSREILYRLPYNHTTSTILQPNNTYLYIKQLSTDINEQNINNNTITKNYISQIKVDNPPTIVKTCISDDTKQQYNDENVPCQYYKHQVPWTVNKKNFKSDDKNNIQKYDKTQIKNIKNIKEPLIQYVDYKKRNSNSTTEFIDKNNICYKKNNEIKKKNIIKKNIKKDNDINISSYSTAVVGDINNNTDNNNTVNLNNSTVNTINSNTNVCSYTKINKCIITQNTNEYNNLYQISQTSIQNILRKNRTLTNNLSQNIQLNYAITLHSQMAYQTSVNQTSQQHSSQLCVFHMSATGCVKTEKCDYQHQKPRPCVYRQIYNTCTRGDLCKFQHIIPNSTFLDTTQQRMYQNQIPYCIFIAIRDIFSQSNILLDNTNESIIFENNNEIVKNITKVDMIQDEKKNIQNIIQKQQNNNLFQNNRQVYKQLLLQDKENTNNTKQYFFPMQIHFIQQINNQDTCDTTSSIIQDVEGEQVTQEEDEQQVQQEEQDNISLVSSSILFQSEQEQQKMHSIRNDPNITIKMIQHLKDDNTILSQHKTQVFLVFCEVVIIVSGILHSLINTLQSGNTKIFDNQSDEQRSMLSNARNMLVTNRHTLTFIENIITLTVNRYLLRKKDREGKKIRKRKQRSAFCIDTRVHSQLYLLTSRLQFLKDKHELSLAQRKNNQ